MRTASVLLFASLGFACAKYEPYQKSFGSKQGAESDRKVDTFDGTTPETKKTEKTAIPNTVVSKPLAEGIASSTPPPVSTKPCLIPPPATEVL